MLCLLSLCGLLLSTAHADDFRFHWKTESAIISISIGSYFYTKTLEPRRQDEAANPKGIDAIGHPRWNPEQKTISDFLGHPFKLYGLNAPVLSTLALGVISGKQKGASAGLQRSLVVVETVALNAVVTNALKLLISRPRPFTSVDFQNTYPKVYSGSHLQNEFDDGGSHLSMPSGHTSSAGACYFSIASILAMDGMLSPWVSYGTAGILTSLTGWSRVHYGVHHPSDVIVGALLGAGLGIGMAKIHYQKDSRLSLFSSQQNMGLSFRQNW